jgi:hypothetical protein
VFVDLLFLEFRRPSVSCVSLIKSYVHLQYPSDSKWTEKFEDAREVIGNR